MDTEDKVKEIYLRYRKGTISFSQMHVELFRLQNEGDCRLEPVLHRVLNAYDLFILYTVERVNNLTL